MKENKTICDYYSKFDGEPEIVIYSNKTKIKEIHIWEGYFDNIVMQIKPSKDGWDGIAYYYNLHEGWYDSSPWKIPNLKLFYEQLNRIDRLFLKSIENEILNNILILFQEAIFLSCTVYINYF